MFYPWIPTKPLIWRLATNTYASLRPACPSGSVARAVPATREARRGAARARQGTTAQPKRAHGFAAEAHG